MESLEVTTHHWDTFEWAREQYGQYDVVLTNPPWELLKPDPRQLRGLSDPEALAYSQSLRIEDARLSELYPAARPSVRYAGWGFNLSRAGMELALGLLDERGALGLIMPASVLADNSSGRLRELMVKQFNLLALDYFPSETRLFPGTDHPAVSLLIGREARHGVSTNLTVFSPSLQARASGRLRISMEELRRTGYVIPGQFSPEAYSVLRKIRQFDEFSELEGKGPAALLAGRELDETRIGERLSSAGSIPFVKGRMVHRFGVDMREARFLKPGVELPESTAHARIAWRDVSRMSQARRIQACLLPPDVVTGNSLSVAYFRDDDPVRLKALLAIMSSVVFEFQVRTYLATSHISLASVRKGRIPSLESEDFVKNMARLCNLCVSGDPAAQAETEVRSAQAFGISREQVGVILGEFGRLPAATKGELLSSKCWDDTPGWIGM